MAKEILVPVTAELQQAVKDWQRADRELALALAEVEKRKRALNRRLADVRRMVKKLRSEGMAVELPS